MTSNFKYNVASSVQLEKELCFRIEKIRLFRNISQKQLALESGVSLRTIGRLEKGLSVSLDTFIRVLIALDLEPHLEALLPDPEIRPIERVGVSVAERASKPSSPGTHGDSGPVDTS